MIQRRRTRFFSFLLALALVFGLVPWTTMAARAAGNTVSYSLEKVSTGIYCLVGSDGTRSDNFKLDGHEIELSVGSDVTVRIASADGKVLIVGRVEETVMSGDIPLEGDSYLVFNNGKIDVTITHRSRYITACTLYGLWKAENSCEVTTTETDVNAHTCVAHWVDDGRRLGSLWKIEATFSDTQNHFRIDTVQKASGASGTFGTVTLDPGASGLVGGETVAVRVTPNPGYVLQSLAAQDDRGRVVSIVDGSFAMPCANVTLTATFTAVVYTIHYEANGGAGTMADISVRGEHLAGGCAFTRAGCIFMGWNTQSDGSGTSYAPDDVVAVPANGGTVTLYAQWRETGADDPFRVTSLAELNALAARVSAGESFEGVYILQTEDITGFTGTIGTEGHPFRGSYDGGGHALTVAIAGGKGCAPFGWVENASFRNLTVAGTVEAGTETSFLGGLVAWASGDFINVENCTVTASLTGAGEGSFGGFMAANFSRSCTLTNCVFRGSLLGSAQSAAGFGNAAACTDCFFAPAAAEMTANGSEYTFGFDSRALTRCYYTTALGREKQGTQVYAAAPAGVSGAIALHGGTYYAAASVDGVRAVYAQTGGVIHPKPVVKAYDGTVLTENTHYTVAYSAADDSAVGSYSLTVKGRGAYTGEQSIDYRVAVNQGNWIDYRAEGELPHEISTAEQLALLAYNVNNGNRYKNETFYLTADIDLSGRYWTPIGRMGADNKLKIFEGSLCGNGHVISGLATDPVDKPAYAGLFGIVANEVLQGEAFIEGIVLTDCDVAGSKSAGAIAGDLRGDLPYQLRSCLVLGGSVSSDTANCGAFYGVKGTNSGAYNCYCENLSLNGGEPSGSAHHTAVFDGNVPAETVRVSDKYRNYAPVFYQGKLLAGEGLTVHFTPAAQAGMLPNVTYTYGGEDHNAAPEAHGVCAFTMPAQDVAVSVEYAPCALAGKGTQAEPYMIGGEDDWTYLTEHPVLCDANFRLGGDVSVTESLGTSAAPFTGIFDGGGYTLTVALTGADDYCAPFRYVDGATIRNLHTAGTVTTSCKYGGGLIGESKGAVTITNCRSSVAVSSSVDGDGTHGGLAAAQSDTLTIVGCVFDGSITGENTTNCGGFVGWKNGTLTIENSLMAGTMTLKTTDGSATFSRNGVTPVNSYYLTAYGAEQGTLAQRVTAGEGVTLGGVGGTQYAVSGVTAYETGMRYGDALLAGAGETLALTLRDDWSAGYTVSFAASAGTLAEADGAYTLVMPESGGVTVTAAYTPVQYTLTLDAADGSAAQTIAYTVESDAALPEPTREGYAFAGWQVTAANGGWTWGAVFEAGETLLGKYGNATLTARWTLTGRRVEGTWNGGRLVANVTIPANTTALLIAASYDASGRQAEVRTLAVTADRTACETGLAKTDGYAYKLLLVDPVTFAPLCAAWESGKSNTEN